MSAPRRILVVGGVAGGMSFAARARRIDESAEIVVFERGLHPSFANCGLPYFVSGEIAKQSALLVQTPESLRAALNLDVRVGHDVIAVDAAAKTVTVRSAAGETVESYDELLLAPGAASVVPAVPGIDAEFVSLMRTVEDAVAMHARATDARSAVVVGGGYIGLESAEALRMRGLDVHLVQRGAHVLTHLERELASLVTDELHAHGVQVHTGAGLAEVLTDERAVLLADGTKLDADIVLIAVGAVPDTAFVADLGITDDAGFIVVTENGRTSQPHVWAVGDATAVTDPLTGTRLVSALAGPANRNGRLTADAMLTTNPRPQPAPLRTAVLRVFDQTVAMTGHNRAELEAAGIAIETLHLHAASHAGYFPGAEPIHLVVHFAAEGSAVPTGTILGAQAVGKYGVDKRIDVLATAMRGGLLATDLIDLDLAYAPPYGSAKDPITMVGLVADNVLSGLTTLWYPWQLQDDSDALILDVRRNDEWAKGRLPGALHIPHTELRDRVDEVRSAAAGRLVRIHCASGVRSYIAHRVLAAAGIESATLSGGMQTLLAYNGKGILHADD